MAPHLVAGIDSSTQSTKIELRERNGGRVVAVGRASHPPTTPPVSEQDPDAWWSALVGACGQVGDHLADVAAVSVAGQQHGMVLVDAAGLVIRPAKLWNDTESAPEAARLVERLGPDGWAEACGSVPVAAFTVSKLAWMAAHEPEALARVHRVMLPHDWLTWRLAGAHVTDRGDASGTGWFDPSAGCYRPELLALVDGRDDWLERLPNLLGPTDTAGVVTAEAAAATGLPAGIPVGPGTGDNMAAALGLGLAPGDVALSLGTSGTVYARSSTPTADPSGQVAGFADAAGGFLPLVCTLNATKVTDAVRGWLGLDHDAFAAAALAAPPDGPVLVPWFDGERTPNLPDAAGWLVGLRTDTSREQLARAAHEGVVCGLLEGLDALAEAGARADGTLHLIGGGAHSAAYRQLVADLHGAPITVPDDDETVATGACVQAAAVLGDDASAVARAWRLGAGPTVEPGPVADGAARRSRYREAIAVAGPAS